jgi:hypothetical protein
VEDYLSDENDSEVEETGLACKVCEHYQQEIYRLNHMLRTNLSNEEHQKTREHLADLVQLQLQHQREHVM